jgi:hypothetical protein
VAQRGIPRGVAVEQDRPHRLNIRRHPREFQAGEARRLRGAGRSRTPRRGCSTPRRGGRPGR